MAEKVRSSSARQLLARRCVRCGYDGVTPRGIVLLETFTTSVEIMPECCPSCGCDFGERPPRSYAEMEGLLGRPFAADFDASCRTQRDESSLIQRWLAFLFIIMLMFVAMVYLTAEAFEVQ
jgi:hypothetical protein